MAASTRCVCCFCESLTSCRSSRPTSTHAVHTNSGHLPGAARGCRGHSLATAVAVVVCISLDQVAFDDSGCAAVTAVHPGQRKSWVSVRQPSKSSLVEESRHRWQSCVSATPCSIPACSAQQATSTLLLYHTRQQSTASQNQTCCQDCDALSKWLDARCPTAEAAYACRC